MNVPPNAIQLTPDGELWKLVLKPGISHKCSVIRPNTCIAVDYIVRSSEGIVDHSTPDRPAVWINGDRESEGSVFTFLPVVAKTMLENEEAQYFFTKKWLTGSSMLVTVNGRIDYSESFEAIVRFIKAEPLEQISIPIDNSSKIKPSSAKSSLNEKELDNIKNPEPKNPEPKKPESNNHEEFQKTISNEQLSIKQAKYGLSRLQIADELFSKKQIVKSRKEYNRAMMAWINNFNLSEAPSEFSHFILSESPENQKNYVFSRAHYGVAMTFLAINPQNKEKAISSLRESLKFDPNFSESLKAISDLGVDIFDKKLPEFTDLRLNKEDFWQDQNIPWKYRIDFSEYQRNEGKKLFSIADFKSAFKMFNKMTISFPPIASLNDEQSKKEVYEKTIISKLNAIACLIEMKQHHQALTNSNLLLDIIQKANDSNFDVYKVKCLYRKAIALIEMDDDDKFINEVFEQLSHYQKGSLLIPKLKKLILEREKEEQKYQDFLYKKMTSTNFHK